MKSFYIGTAVAILIAVVASFALEQFGQTAGDKFSTDSVRLDVK